MNNGKYRTASNIYRTIVDSQILRGYTVIITGRNGPTGKTTLCKLLVNAGVQAIEISDSLNGYVEYVDTNENKFIVDAYNESVLVILNRLR